MQYKEAHVFLDKLEDMIKFLIPNRSASAGIPYLNPKDKIVINKFLNS